MTTIIESYARDVIKRLQQLVETQQRPMEMAARWIADTLQQDGLIFVTGTGHSHMLAEEVFYRAGGLMAISPILTAPLMLHEGALKSTVMERTEGFAKILLTDAGVTPTDLLIVVSNSGGNAVPVEMALEARALGCRVIALTSLEHSRSIDSRHSSGKRLFEVADLVLDNQAPYGDAILTIDGLPARMGPVSTITGAFALQAITAQAGEMLVDKGFVPDVFVSANVAALDGDSEETLQRYRHRIRML